MKATVVLVSKEPGRRKGSGTRSVVQVDLADWAGWYRHWTKECRLDRIDVWAGRAMPLARFEYIARHGWRQTMAGRHPLPRPARASNVRQFRRLPEGGITVPVKGISFREGQWPENVWRLREIIAIAGTLTDAPRWEIRRFKPGPWRGAIETVLDWGRLPVRLVHEPDNPHDPHAVAVWCPYLGDYGFLGYVPASSHGAPNRVVAAGLDAGERWWGYVAKIRIHPDHPDHPGIDITIRRTDLQAKAS